MTKGLSDRTHIPLNRDELAKIRAKAIRRGIWFRVLTRAERAQMELTMTVVKRVRSLLLARVLTSVIKKLLEAMESKVTRIMREVGKRLAKKLSQIGQSWGNKSAARWAMDLSFMKFLSINYMNTPAMFKA